MLLKRIYEIPEGWEPQRDAEGRLLNPLPIAGLHVRHTGVQPEQNFSRRLVDAGLREGWLTLSRGELLLHTAQGDLRYTVLRTPGTYCCHCAAVLGDDATGEVGRAHIAAVHAGVVHPAEHPGGYRHTNAYECVLDAAQHAKWMRPAGATVSGWRGKKKVGINSKKE